MAIDNVRVIGAGAMDPGTAQAGVARAHIPQHSDEPIGSACWPVISLHCVSSIRPVCAGVILLR
jgi:hypothetical protein